jgi:hypothetical protein
VQESAFNGALHTLDRVNELIKSVTSYRVNEHLLGFKLNLRELLIEGQGFLKQPEFKEAWLKWAEIESFPVVIDREEGKVSFDHRLWPKLDDFNSWLRLKLHENHVTMVSRKEWEAGISKVRKRLGLF